MGLLAKMRRRHAAAELAADRRFAEALHDAFARQAEEQRARLASALESGELGEAVTVAIRASGPDWSMPPDANPLDDIAELCRRLETAR
jgi:hypothetical protein